MAAGGAAVKESSIRSEAGDVLHVRTRSRRLSASTPLPGVLLVSCIAVSTRFPWFHPEGLSSAVCRETRVGGKDIRRGSDVLTRACGLDSQIQRLGAVMIGGQSNELQLEVVAAQAQQRPVVQVGPASQPQALEGPQAHPRTTFLPLRAPTARWCILEIPAESPTGCCVSSSVVSGFGLAALACPGCLCLSGSLVLGLCVRPPEKPLLVAAN